MRFPRVRRSKEDRSGQETPMDNFSDRRSSTRTYSSIRQHEPLETSDSESDVDNEVMTYKEAIQESDFVSLRRLLEAGVPIADNLLFAITQGSLNAVKIICSYYQNKGSPVMLDHIVNRFPQESDYLPTATPLQIAAKSNDYQIIKVLLRHGAVIPTLEDCLERVGSDIIVRSLVFLLHTKASCSPALLVAKETNPVGEALRLVHHLDDNTFMNETHSWFVSHRSFRDGLAEIRQTLEDFLCNILDNCKNRSEVDSILEIQANYRLDDSTGGSDSVLSKIGMNMWEDSALPPGMEEAISLNFKKYVTHPYAQSILMERAFEGPVSWEKMSSLRFSLFSLMLVIISPLLCLTYALLPIPKLILFMRTPYVRILNTFSSHLIFMSFLFLSTLNLTYHPVEGEIPNNILPVGNFTGQIVMHQYWTLGKRMAILALLILGEAIWLVYHLYRMGIRMFARQVWNWINIIQTSFFVASLGAYLATYLESNTVIAQYLDGSIPAGDRVTPKHTSNGTHLFESSRPTWSTFDSTLIAELTFAIGNSLTVLRLLYTFTLLDFLGPLVMAMSRMFLTLGRYLVISVLLIMSFALGLTQLFAPYQSLPPCTDADDDHSFCGDASFFKSLKESVLTLFWAVFGDFAITGLQLPPNLQLITNSGHIMHAIFVILMTIAIMNMLIATIMSVFDSIQGNIDTEWKFARTKMLEEHLGERANLPPPYNLIPSVRFIVNSICHVFRWFYKIFHRVKAEYLKTDRRNRYNWSRKYHQSPSGGGQDTQETRQRIYKERHKVLKIVVGRFIVETFSANESHFGQDDTTQGLAANIKARRRSSVFNIYAYRQSSIRSQRRASSLGAGSIGGTPNYSFKPIVEHNGNHMNLTLPRMDPTRISVTPPTKWARSSSLTVFSSPTTSLV